MELPSGTVTFLFTDLEGSTRLWQEYSRHDAERALVRHDELVRGAIEQHRGYVVKTTGDGFHAAFATSRDALLGGVAAMRAIEGADWGEVGAFRVRMGLHTGEATARDGDYYGPSLNRAARLMSVAHGGQLVCSQVTADLVRDELPGDVDLVDLGEIRLRVPRTVRARSSPCASTGCRRSSRRCVPSTSTRATSHRSSRRSSVARRCWSRSSLISPPPRS